MAVFTFVMAFLLVTTICRCLRLPYPPELSLMTLRRNARNFATSAAVDLDPLRDNIVWKPYKFDLGRRIIEVAEAKDVDVVIDYSIAQKLPEPYGIQVWDGAYLLSQILHNYFQKAPVDNTKSSRSLQVVDLGCGNGLVSLFCASHGISVKALDFNPLTLQLLEMGLNNLVKSSIDAKRVGKVERVLFNMATESQRLPTCDLLLMSDVIYSKELGKLAAKRVAEAINVHNSTVLLTDPGRSTVAYFLEELSARLGGQSLTAPSRKIEFTKVDESVYGVKGQYLCLNDWLHVVS